METRSDQSRLVHVICNPTAEVIQINYESAEIDRAPAIGH